MKSVRRIKEKGHIPLSRPEYMDLFCSDKDILKEAYHRAWETRNFEIDKFWTRTAFFWGFIATIFAGYIAIMTNDNNDKLLSMNFDIYLILLGIIFSFAWLLVVLGSKSWQENWEAHIDMLENEITGPLYKTINYSWSFYSVSKINIFLSIFVLFIWILILKINVRMSKAPDDINWKITIAVILTIISIILMSILCRSAWSKWKIKKSMRRYTNNNGFVTKFINRWEK